MLGRQGLVRTVHTDVQFLHVVPSLDGKTITGGTADGRVVEVDAATGDVVDEWRVADNGLVVGTLGEDGGLAQKLGDTEIRRRDPDGTERTLVRDGLLSAIAGAVLFGGTPLRPADLAVATTSGVRVVDPATGETLRTFDGYAAGWLSVSTDGTRLAIESNAAPWTVTTIDFDSGDARRPDDHASMACHYRAQPRRRSARGRCPGRWRRSPTGRRRDRRHPRDAAHGPALQVAFSDDGALMAAIGQSNDVHVFDTTDGHASSTARSTSVAAAGFASRPIEAASSW